MGINSYKQHMILFLIFFLFFILNGCIQKSFEVYLKNTREFDQIANEFLFIDNLEALGQTIYDTNCNMIAYVNSIYIINICSNYYEIFNLNNHQKTRYFLLSDIKETNINLKVIKKYFDFMKKYEFIRMFRVKNYLLIDYGVKGFLYTPNDQHEEYCDFFPYVNKIVKNWYFYTKKWDHVFSCNSNFEM